MYYYIFSRPLPSPLTLDQRRNKRAFICDLDSDNDRSDFEGDNNGCWSHQLSLKAAYDIVENAVNSRTVDRNALMDAIALLDFSSMYNKKEEDGLTNNEEEVLSGDWYMIFCQGSYFTAPGATQDRWGYLLEHEKVILSMNMQDKTVSLDYPTCKIPCTFYGRMMLLKEKEDQEELLYNLQFDQVVGEKGSLTPLALSPMIDHLLSHDVTLSIIARVGDDSLVVR